MSSDMMPFEELGSKIAETLGRGPDEETVLMQRRDFLAEVSNGSRASRFPMAIGWVAAAVLAVSAVTAGLVLHRHEDKPMTFWVGEDRNEGAEGQWVRAESAALLPIRFQGGSEINLSADGAARIIRATSDGVRIDLASGKVHCSIHSNYHTKWQVEAGPYTVQVTGTVFTTEWDPEHAKLDVTVTRGSVLVTGANLNAHGVQLAVGDHLRVDGEKALIALNPETEPPVATPEAAPAEPPSEAETAPAPAKSAEVVESAPARSGSRASRIAADRNDPLLGADDNLDRILATGDVETLWQLAMQARYNRNGGTAKNALLTIRDRFKDSKRAGTAAFVLGRVYQELQGSPRSAAAWFQRYLDESPNGPLAEESLGRLFDAYDRAGNRRAAARVAEQYLTEYPSGLFVDSARQVLKN